MQFKIVVFSAILLGNFLVMSQATAALEAHTGVSVDGWTVATDDQYGNLGVVSAASAASSFGNGGNVTATASWGVLKVGGSAGAIGSGSGGAGGYAKWADTWTLSTGNLADNGKLVTLNATLLLDGNLQHSIIGADQNAQLSSAGARGEIDVRSGGGCAYCGAFLSGFERSTDEPSPYPDSYEAVINGMPVQSIFQTYSIDIVMMVGESQWFYSQLGGSAGANAAFGGTANAAFNLDKSLYWGGISAAWMDGVKLQQFNLLSESGVNWQQSFIPNSAPVPVPASVWLMSSGLIGLVGMLRRKKSSHLD